MTRRVLGIWIVIGAAGCTDDTVHSPVAEEVVLPDAAAAQQDVPDVGAPDAQAADPDADDTADAPQSGEDVDVPRPPVHRPADSDGDTLTDEAELADDNPATDPAVFNGLRVTIGEAPAGFFSSADCGLFFGKDFGAMSALFKGEIQTHNLLSGWGYVAGNTPNYDDPAHYDFQPPFDNHDNVGVHNSFQIRFSGAIYLDEAGTWCFSVDTGAGGLGPLDIAGRRNSCGRVFIDPTLPSAPLAETGYGSAASPNVGCLDAAAGLHELVIGARHYETHFYSPRLEVRMCFGGSAECTPDKALEAAQLQALAPGEAPPLEPEDPPPDPQDGACTGDADAALIGALGAQGLTDAITPCGTSCFLAADTQSCVADCIASDIGLSAACAQCYAAVTACAIANCAGACIDGGADCDQCMADAGCQDDFSACSGLE